MARALASLVLLADAAMAASSGARAEALFESRQLTRTGEYPAGIEGPAVDAAGNLYVVNLGTMGTIGRVRPGASTSELFAKLPDGSIGNGIRFDRDGRMYVADYKAHTIFLIEPGQATPRAYFPPRPRPGLFDQPNDLAIAADGTLYASDPKGRSGRIWRIMRQPDGTARAAVMRSNRTMGRTNGLDLSPDGRTLYVGESSSRELWAYRIEGDRLVAPERPLMTFDADLDGLRTDVDGRVYVARVESGAVEVVDPQSRTVIRRVPLTGKNPTNLTFGGPDGKTVFVTQADGGYVESFRVERPGREPCLQGVPGTCP
jgi:signal peptidase